MTAKILVWLDGATDAFAVQKDTRSFLSKWMYCKKAKQRKKIWFFFSLKKILCPTLFSLHFIAYVLSKAQGQHKCPNPLLCAAHSFYI